MTLNSSSVLKKILLVFLVVAGAYIAQDFFIPLAIGAVLATLFLPFSNWMERKRIPRWVAASICLLTLLLALAAVGTLVGWQISELSNDFDVIRQRAVDTGTRIQSFLFNQLGLSIQKQGELLSDQQPMFSEFIQGMAITVPGMLYTLLLILVYLVFLLYYRGHIKQFILKLTPDNQRPATEKVIQSVANVSQRYLSGLCKMIACLWIMYGIGFSLLGVKNALFFAFLCGILEIIPFVGNITGTTITLLVAAAQGSSFGVLIGIVGTYSVTQFIQGWVLEPLIVGPHVKINPLFTIIALLIGGLVWGIAGVFLAIPLMAMWKIVCDHFEPLRPYGFLIGEVGPAKEKAAWLRDPRSPSGKH